VSKKAKRREGGPLFEDDRRVIIPDREPPAPLPPLTPPLPRVQSSQVPPPVVPQAAASPLESVVPPVVPDRAASPAPVRPNGGMHQTALVFLDDPLARRLAVAWPACGGDEDRWLDAAGFSIGDREMAKHLAKALRIYKVCRDGGVTDELALHYITAIVTDPLKKRLNDGKPKR